MATSDSRAIDKDGKIVVGNFTEADYREAEKVREKLTERFDKAIKKAVAELAWRDAGIKE